MLATAQWGQVGGGRPLVPGLPENLPGGVVT